VPHQADTSVVHHSGKVALVLANEERLAAAFYYPTTSLQQA